VAEVSECTAIVLAAQRAGVVNALAERAGVSHKCLVPIVGKALILHVMAVLAAVPGVGKVRISAEPDVHGELEELLRSFRESGQTIEFVPSSENIVESVLTAAQGQREPFVITTADNVLLTRDAVERTITALENHDAAMNVARKSDVLAVHPRAQRRFYEFRGGGYANCNLYGIAGPHALKVAEVFREGGQFMKNPGRLVNAFGLFNIFLFRFKLLTLKAAARRMSRRFGLTIAAIVLDDGSQAVDVDNERTYDVAEMVLNQRSAATAD